MSSRGFRTGLTLLVVAGIAVRLALAFGSQGLVFDLRSYVLTDHALGSHPLHVYALVNGPSAYRWPYLSGMFPLLLLARGIGDVSGLAFTSLIRLPAILGDVGIALVLEAFLRRRGCPARLRLLAAGAVLLGPLFVINSAYDGQSDSLAILPAMVAVAMWKPAPSPGRAVAAGALIGVGCALKTFPLLMVLAVLPSCSWRERWLLVLAALAVPALAIAPWLVADGHSVVQALKYHSLTGTGGISLLVQPDLARIWLGQPFRHLTAASRALQGSLGTVVLVLPVALAAGLAWVRRASAHQAAVLLWLTVFAVGVNFGARYAIWGLPFFLMAGQLWRSLAIQVVLVVPTVLLRAAPLSGHGVLYLYVTLMLMSWVAFAAWWIAEARGLVVGAPTPWPASQAGQVPSTPRS